MADEKPNRECDRPGEPRQQNSVSDNQRKDSPPDWQRSNGSHKEEPKR